MLAPTPPPPPGFPNFYNRSIQQRPQPDNAQQMNIRSATMLSPVLSPSSTLFPPSHKVLEEKFLPHHHLSWNLASSSHGLANRRIIAHPSPSGTIAIAHANEIGHNRAICLNKSCLFIRISNCSTQSGLGLEQLSSVYCIKNSLSHLQSLNQNKSNPQLITQIRTYRHQANQVIKMQSMYRGERHQDLWVSLGQLDCKQKLNNEIYS